MAIQPQHHEQRALLPWPNPPTFSPSSPLYNVHLSELQRMNRSMHSLPLPYPPQHNVHSSALQCMNYSMPPSAMTNLPLRLPYPPLYNLQLSELRRMRNYIPPFMHQKPLYPVYLPPIRKRGPNFTPTIASQYPSNAPAHMQMQAPKPALLPTTLTMKLPSEFPYTLSPDPIQARATVDPGFTTLLGIAIQKRNFPKAMAILERATHIDWIDNGHSVITYSIKNNIDKEVIGKLIERVYVVDQDTVFNHTDRENTTALIEACKLLDLDLVTLLLQKADPNFVTHEMGRTALHWLIHHSALDQKSHGHLPMARTDARSRKIVAIARALLDSGASLAIKDSLGHTPMQVLMNKTHANEIDLNLVQLLLERGEQYEEVKRLCLDPFEREVDLNLTNFANQLRSNRLYALHDDCYSTHRNRRFF